MEDHFFSYNAIQKTWQETNCHELSGTLAEYVPQIILIENKEQMVWCPIHHTYETVETLSHSKVSTTDGYILSGAVIPIGAIDITADQDARNCRRVLWRKDAILLGKNCFLWAVFRSGMLESHAPLPLLPYTVADAKLF